MIVSVICVDNDDLSIEYVYAALQAEWVKPKALIQIVYPIYQMMDGDIIISEEVGK